MVILISEKILVTGGNGLLASYLGKHDGVLCLPKTELDVTNKIQIKEVMKKHKPEIIIHTAVMNDVNQCELNKEKAYLINVVGTRNIIETGIKTIFLSSDYVFDGKKGEVYEPDDETNPLNYYGVTKVEGEEITLKNLENSVVRTTIIFGNHPKMNFVNWLVEKLRNGEKLKIVNDQYGTPTYAKELAKSILKIKDKSGILHLAGPEYLSRYEFSMKISDVFDLDRNLIEECTSEELKQIAKRALNLGLKSDIKMEPLKDSLEDMKNEYRKPD